MSERPTPETDALAETLIPLAENITASNAQNVIKQILIEILTKTTTLERERDEAREALDRIARPVWWMQEDQKRKTGSINGISGGMALALSEDAEYLKGIAKSALKGKTK